MAQKPPMLGQYRQIKARYADALLLYRLGDFYELFEQDAEVVARQLGLVLTTRRFAKDLRLPMCGIPHHRLDTYVARLIRLGHKVAIAEQLESASKTRRLVRRDVVRVITPGTVVEKALLNEHEQSLLVGIVLGDGRRADRQGTGLAVIDLSTGEFSATQIGGPSARQQLTEELSRLAPKEVVLPKHLADDDTIKRCLDSIQTERVSTHADAAFTIKAAQDRLCTHFGIVTLEGFGCDERPLAVAAAGGVLDYLQENQISDLAHIIHLATYDLTAYVGLDTITRRNLEIVRTLREGRRQGSLHRTLDHTVTAMGGRLLQRWLQQPLTDLAAIQDRQSVVRELVDGALVRSDLRTALDGLYDMERLVGRIGFGNANARDLVALCLSLERIPDIRQVLQSCQSKRLRALGSTLNAEALPRVATLIGQAINNDPPILLREGGLIRTGYDELLERLRKTAQQGRDWLAELESSERERTGIPNLRVRYNQVFGFYIEVTKSHLSKVPADYERRATVRNAERFVTPALKERETQILTAEDQSKDREYELFVEVRRQVAAEARTLTEAARALAQLDVFSSLAEVAAQYNYVCPDVHSGHGLVIREGRHAVVEHTLRDGERFVPNDTRLDDKERLMILTGPNMSGKSVYIRQVALIALLAQVGSYVPAAEAEIGITDHIFVRAGATDDIAQGRSSFLVEMSETGYILHHATERSLVVLDEVGRGTSTYDGLSIAWAVAEALHDRGTRTLFATHFHELTQLAEHLEAAQNHTLAVTERGQQVIFLRQLVLGGAEKSFGIQVARLAGLPEHVVSRAQQILDQLEQDQSVAQPTLKSLPQQPVLEPQPKESAHVTEANNGALEKLAREIHSLDIANMTPVQALVTLNDLQARLAHPDKEPPICSENSEAVSQV